jgi:hypothetical protein
MCETKIEKGHKNIAAVDWDKDTKKMATLFMIRK